MKKLLAFNQFVVLVSLPLLVGGCGSNDEAIDEIPVQKGPLSDIENEVVGEYSGVFPFLGLVEVTLHQDRTTTILNKETREKFTEKWRFDGRKLTIGSSSWWLDHDFNFTSADSPWKKLKRKIVNKVKGDFRYSVRGNTITITKCNPRVSGELIIPTAIEGKAVTFIGDVAFKGCGSLTTITIPDGVNWIGWGAFSDCTSLTSIAIPDGVTWIREEVFSGCSSLTSITIPESVTSIEKGTFAACTKLTSITIPYNVTSIGAEAFRNCTGLTSITIGNGVTSIGERAFWGCTNLTSITIPDSVTSIGGGAFYKCSGLESITVPDSVTRIEGSVFEECTSLISVTIGNSVTRIGNLAFGDCPSLTSITIPDRVRTIGDRVFIGCTSLTSITFPDGVRTIGDSVFSGCSSLSSITFLGDRPQSSTRVLGKTTPVIYRKPDAKGWGETFRGRPVKLISEKP
jgi:hypothetical protein